MKIKKHSQTILDYSIATYSSDEDQNFTDCLFVLTGQQLLIKANNIDAKKLEYIVRLAKEISLKENLESDVLRFSFTQLDSPLEGWSKIQQHHYLLKQLMWQHAQNYELTHLSLPTEKIYLEADITRFMKRTAENLVSHFDSEAWITYCRWLALEIKTFLVNFKPDALDEYRLQARLEDYLHEIESPLLYAVQQNIDEAIRQQKFLSAKEDYDQFFFLEKTIIAAEGRIKTSLEVLWRLLKDIFEEIDIIEEAHPELNALKITSYLFHAVLSHQLDPEKVINWPQFVLLVQLLNQRLHVITVVNNSIEDGRTNIIYAISLAIAELSQNLSIETLIKLCETWDESNRQDPQAEILRQLVIANGKSLFSTVNPPLLINSEEWRYNLDLLSFLPQKTKMLLDNEEREITLFEIEPITRKPIKCTDDGLYLLSTLRFLPYI